MAGPKPGNRDRVQDAPVPLSFEEIAQVTLDEWGVVAGREDSLDLFSQARAEQFLRLPLGLFELDYPIAALADGEGCRRFQDLATLLLDLQDRWLHLTQGVKPRRGKSLAEEAPLLKKWIRSWRPIPPDEGAAGTGGAASAPQRSLAEVLQAPADVREALRGFVVRMRSGRDLGWEREAHAGVSVLLAPDRQTFVGLCAVLGLARAEARPAAWIPATLQSTVFRWQDLQILALEYPDPTGVGEDYRRGQSMNARDRTGELQHVAHHGTLHMISAWFGADLDPAVESGLATHLTVDLLGEDNARVGGAENGSSVAGRSKFVVGGRSEGGKFPKLSAESSWRVDKGEDYFLGALRSGQKRGQKEMPKDAPSAQKHGWLLLESATGGPGRPVCAPFLGDDPGTSDLEDEYVDDAQELFRAYGCGFVHWLLEQKARGDRSAEESFARLLRLMASEGAVFAAAVEEVYGAPLTTREPKAGGLEWEFLKDLSRR